MLMNYVINTVKGFIFYDYERLLISVKIAVNSGTESDKVIEILKLKKAFEL